MANPVKSATKLSKHEKPNMPKGPGAKGDGEKAAMKMQGKSPSKLNGMAGAKKKER